MSGSALARPEGPHWADLVAAWLTRPLRFHLLAWGVVPLLALGCIVAPLAAAAITLVVLLFALLWRRPFALVFLLVVLMGNVKINFYAGFFTVFPEYLPLALAAFIWALRWAEGTRRLEEPRLALLCGAFVLVGAVSFPDAISLGRVFAKAVLVGVAMVTFLLTLDALRDRRSIRWALGWLEVSALVMALYGILQVVGDFVGFDTSLTYFKKWGNPGFYYGIGAPVVYRLARFFRADSLFNDPNILAGYLAATLPVVLALRIVHGESSRKRWIAHGESALLLVLMLCLLLTLSRSGIIAVLCGFAVVLWFLPRALRSARFWLGAAGGIAGVGVLATAIGLNPLLILTRLGMIFDNKESSAQLHKGIFAYGVDLFVRHLPTGVGLGNFGLYYGSYVSAYYPNMMTHNAYLTYFAETGVIGGALFLVLVVAILLRPWRALRDPRVHADRELLAWNAGLLGAMLALDVASLFYDYYLRTFIWVFAALAVAAARQVKLQAADA